MVWTDCKCLVNFPGFILEYLCTKARSCASARELMELDAVFDRDRYWNRVDDESLDVGQDALWWCCSDMRNNSCISQHNITLCSVDWLIIFYYLPTNKIFTWSVFRSVKEHDNATGNEKSSPEFMNTSLWIIGLIDLHEKSIKIEWEDGIKHTIMKLYILTFSGLIKLIGWA